MRASLSRLLLCDNGHETTNDERVQEKFTSHGPSRTDIYTRYEQFNASISHLTKSLKAKGEERRVVYTSPSRMAFMCSPSLVLTTMVLNRLRLHHQVPTILLLTGW